MREFKPSTWFGEQLLQQWGHWCIQHLETFGFGAGGEPDGGERRITRAAGDYSDPVLAKIMSTELASGLSQTIHLQIADRPALDRRVAMLRYVGKPMQLAERGGEPVVWFGEITIGRGAKGKIEFPQPPFLDTVCIPVGDDPAAIGRELGLTAEQVREATRRLRALALKAFRRVNDNKRRKAA